MTSITLAICTRDRPQELGELMSSLGRTRFRRSQQPTVDVLVVENGPNRSDLDADELTRRCGWPVRIIHEPRPGVAFARNTAIANRDPSADWLVCVDDDETVTPSWLEHHLLYASTSAADVITGPVLTRIPDDASPMARAFWQNIPRHPSGTRERSFLGGNVCFRNDLFDELDTWYNEKYATSTADDTDLGRRLTAAGYIIEWNDRAIAWEAVPPARLRTRWFVERFLSYGGFESISLRRDQGWVDGVLPTLPAELWRLARGVGLGLTSYGDRPARRAQALADTCFAFGWLGGLVGYRVRDYRTMTTTSV